MLEVFLLIMLTVIAFCKASLFVSEVNLGGLTSNVIRLWYLEFLVFNGGLLFLPLAFSQRACLFIFLLLSGVHFHAILKEGDISPKVSNSHLRPSASIC